MQAIGVTKPFRQDTKGFCKRTNNLLCCSPLQDAAWKKEGKKRNISYIYFTCIQPNLNSSGHGSNQMRIWVREHPVNPAVRQLPGEHRTLAQDLNVQQSCFPHYTNILIPLSLPSGEIRSSSWEVRGYKWEENEAWSDLGMGWQPEGCSCAGSTELPGRKATHWTSLLPLPRQPFLTCQQMESFKIQSILKSKYWIFRLVIKIRRRWYWGGVGGGGVGGTNKVKCAEQVTTNIWAIILV